MWWWQSVKVIFCEVNFDGNPRNIVPCPTRCVSFVRTIGDVTLVSYRRGDGGTWGSVFLILRDSFVILGGAGFLGSQGTGWIIILFDRGFE